MDVAIGLPNAVPGTTGAELVEWARRAEARGFSSLGTLDRLVYPNYEPLTALAAAAAVTERIGLCTAVLLGPPRVSGAALAKQTKSLHALSGERFTLGIAIGGREDDYEFAEVDMGDRGEDLDAMLAKLDAAWDDDRIGPAVESRPGLIVGGGVGAAYKRVAEFGEGWVAGGLPPDKFAEGLAEVKKAWEEAGRHGEPKSQALAYFSLGDDAKARADAYLVNYYAWLGGETAQFIADSAAKDADTVKGYIGAFEGVGCDELILFPCSSDPAQVDLLADAAGV
jgi:alkanesulfonate monooxygenase SsuD/methylene tetrahydromethanopterin reductase-like flavin-dependent oxidoreductase (luciferase family)